MMKNRHFCHFPGGGPGKRQIFTRCTAISRGFFRVFSESFGKSSIFGVPVIKEEKAIALRAIDIFVCLFLVRNAMDPGSWGDHPEFLGKWGSIWSPK